MNTILTIETSLIMSSPVTAKTARLNIAVFVASGSSDREIIDRFRNPGHQNYNPELQKNLYEKGIF